MQISDGAHIALGWGSCSRYKMNSLVGQLNLTRVNYLKP